MARRGIVRSVGLGLVFIAFLCWLLWPKPPKFNHEQILHAIWLVESSGQLNPPRGDQGRALGPLQIHRNYWLDAGIPGNYEDCAELSYSWQVLQAYMQIYVPMAWENADAEVIARTHNGGPFGARKESTLPYWDKVQRQLLLNSGYIQ